MPNTIQRATEFKPELSTVYMGSTLTGVDHRETLRCTSVIQLFVGNYRVSSDLVQLLNAGFIEITFWAEHLLFIATYDTDVRLVYDEVEAL